jgi:hypothetical protein
MGNRHPREQHAAWQTVITNYFVKSRESARTTRSALSLKGIDADHINALISGLKRARKVVHCEGGRPEIACILLQELFGERGFQVPPWSRMQVLESCKEAIERTVGPIGRSSLTARLPVASLDTP